MDTRSDESGPGADRRARGLRVLTMNVLERRYASWEERRDVLAAGIRRLAPDVVALQEVVREGGYDGVAELLGPGWHVAAHPRWSAGGVGAALASRWPLGDVRRDALRVTPRTEVSSWCGVTVAEIRAPGPLGPFLVAHHKPSWPYDFEHERELQAVAAARLIEDHLADRAAHVVLMGDLDAPPDAASIRFWTGRQSLYGESVCYRDAWQAVRPGDPGHTFTPDNPLVRRGDMPAEPGRRIDYVMVRCGHHGPTLNVRACDRFLAGPVDGVWASDHYGVFADLTLPARPPGSWPDP